MHLLQLFQSVKIAVLCIDVMWFESVHVKSSYLFLLGPRNSWPVATAVRGPSLGQLRSDIPNMSAYRPIQRQQIPRSRNPSASNTAWNRMPVQQPPAPARPFGK